MYVCIFKTYRKVNFTVVFAMDNIDHSIGESSLFGQLH